MNENFSDMFKGLSSAQLAEGVARAREFIATEQGKRALESLKRGEKIDESILPPGSNEIVRNLSNNPALLKALTKYLG